MSGHLGDLSQKQEKLLNEFKIIIKDVLNTDEHDDRLLLQFLRARKFDLKKTEDMFRKHVNWRKQYPKKFLLNEFKPGEVMEKYFYTPFLGFDKQGSPIRILPAEADLRGITSSVKFTEIMQFAAYIMEKDIADAQVYNEKFNRHVEERTLIFDLGQLKIRQLLHKPTYNNLVSILKIFEANYPESLKAVYIINAPYFFSWILSVLKTIAADTTLDKLRVYGEVGWKEDMLKEIDADVLPDWLGQPDYVSTLNLRTQVPEHYYLRNQCRLQKDAENVTQCLLKRRAKQEVPMFIDTEGSTIVWNVECADADINVGLFYKNREMASSQYGESKLEVLVPFAKAGGDFGPSTGSYVTQKSGVYVLVFDNTYSLLRSKHVTYSMDVLPPVTKMAPENIGRHEIICA